jgi:hypothetical protein
MIKSVPNARSGWDLIDDPGLDRARNVVENTEESVAKNPVVGLMTAMPGGIEASEKRGQAQLVESDIIPAEIQAPYSSNGMRSVGAGVAILKSWGFYDRSAHLSISARYTVTYVHEDEKDRTSRCRGVVKEGESILFAGEWIKPDANKPWVAHDDATKAASEWFKTNLPESIVDQWNLP